MPYIPEAHKKYNLLPLCVEHGGEVFSYPPDESDISSMLPENESVIPYGYMSYTEFDDELNLLINTYGITEDSLNDLGHKLVEYRGNIQAMNIKENWSVLKYWGETNSSLTRGRCYYWPCSVENPVYEGVIDNEEFTSYLAFDISGRAHTSLDTVSFKSAIDETTEWEILEDLTGIAARTLSRK